MLSWQGGAVGVLVQPLAALFKPLVTPAVALLLISTVLRLDWGQVFDRLRAPLHPLIIVVWLLVGAPLVLWAAMAVVEPPAVLRGPLLLSASSPVLISVPAFALMMGLDGPLALVVMVATSLLQPLVQPPPWMKARVGAPSLPNAAATAGPSFSLTLSGCSAATDSMCSASRRGAPP